MTSLAEQVRYGADQAWASLAEGWRDPRHRASGALTRFRREDLHIEIDADRLCVSGEKRVDSAAREGGLHLVQCAYGTFRRELPLPVQADRAASDRDGVLRIAVPRLSPARGRRIPVQGG